MNEATRERVLGLLVDEAYARALGAGHVIRNPAGWRQSQRTATERQIAAQPGWLQQQADRLLGEVKRPGTAHQCPECGISFNPHDRATLPAIPSPPLHDRWTNGDKIVTVPPEHEGAYQRLGYQRLEPELDATLHATPPPSTDEPTRGADGLLYCRASCAAGEPTVTLDEWLATNPDRADPRGYIDADTTRL